MKLGQFFKKMVGGSMILAAMACPVFTSCYDDSKLWAEMGKVKDQVASLESRLNDQLAALQYMLGADSKIKDVKWDDTNKKWNFTLADGSTFDFAPLTNAENQQKFQSLITTVEVDGAKYWATYGADGVATPLTDEDGNMYPVSVTPQVMTEDGVTYLSLDGETWVPTCSNPSVFVGVEVVYTDNYTDEQEAEGDWYQESPLYVIFTLADGNTVTLSLEGVAYCTLGNPHRGPAPEEMFVAAGGVFVQEAVSVNTVEYFISAPSGWLVEDEIVYEGDGQKQIALNITAPSAAAIRAGLALPGGYLKLVGFAEGGKTLTPSKMYLTTEPYSTFSASNGKVSIVPVYGNLKYFYGVCEKNSFDPAAIEQTIISEEANDPYGYGDRTYLCAENDGWDSDGTVNALVSDLLENAQVGETYVLWAMPSMTDFVKGGYIFSESTIVSTEFLNRSILQNEEDVVTTFNSISTKISFNGVTSVFAGCGVANGNELPFAEDLLGQINMYLEYGMADYIPQLPAPESGVYEGNPMELLGESSLVDPNTTYYVWFVIPDASKTKYTAADLIMFTYTSGSVSAGGSLTVALGENIEAANKYTKISTTLTSPDASMFYYAWVDPTMLPTISDKAAYLMENGSLAAPEEGGACVVGTDGIQLEPEKSMILLATAVDAEGKYGEIAEKAYSTLPYTFSDVTLSLSIVGDPVYGYNDFVVTASDPTAITEYRYFFKSIYSYEWSMYGGTVESLEKAIALGSCSTMKAVPDETGAFEAYANAYEPFVMIIMGKTADGVYTKAATLNLNIMFNLGDFVGSKDANGNDNTEWTSKKPTVTITKGETTEFTPISYTITGIPEGFTAQAACFHMDYLTDYATGKDKTNYVLTNPDTVGLEEVAEGDTLSYFYGSPGYIVVVILKNAAGDYYELYTYDCGVTGGFGV